MVLRDRPFGSCWELDMVIRVRPQFGGISALLRRDIRELALSLVCVCKGEAGSTQQEGSCPQARKRALTRKLTLLEL